MRIAVDGTYFGVLPSLTSEQLIALTVDCGAEGVNWPFHERFGMADTGAVARQLDEAGLLAVSLGLNSHISAVPGAEQEFQAYAERAIAAAHTLGTSILDCWPRRAEGVTKQQAQETLRTNVEALQPILERACVTLALEFEPDTTLERFPEAIAFIAPYYPQVSITADCYHVARIGDDLAEAATAVAPHLAIMHLSASHRGEPGSPGDTCDHAAFIAAAQEAGYPGDVLLQYQAEGDMRESLRRAVSYVRALLKEA